MSYLPVILGCQPSPLLSLSHSFNTREARRKQHYDAVVQQLPLLTDVLQSYEDVRLDSSEVVVNLGQLTMASRSSRRDILLCGSHSKIRRKIVFNSKEIGNIELKYIGSLRKARNAESSGEALSQGLRPQVRLTRMTPRLQTSLGAVAN